jgi:TonB family protein
MSRYHTVSLLIHIIVIIIFAWWPTFFVSHIQEESPINVQLVAPSELTNIKKIEQAKKNSKKPAAEPKPSPPAPPKQSHDTPSKPLPTAEKKPEIAKEIEKAEVLEKKKDKPKQQVKPEASTKALPQKKPEAKKEEKKTKTQKTASKADKNTKEDNNFSEMMLKTLEESNANKREKQKKADEVAQMAEKMFSDTEKMSDPELPLSIAEKDSIMEQINDNWNKTGFLGAENAGMIVTLRINIDLDGNVTSVKILKEPNSNPVYNVFVESTVRAVKKASPLQNLPREKFNTWRETEMRFYSTGSIS